VSITDEEIRIAGFEIDAQGNLFLTVFRLIESRKKQIIARPVSYNLASVTQARLIGKL
jgi:hypothetical protein